MNQIGFYVLSENLFFIYAIILEKHELITLNTELFKEILF